MAGDNVELTFVRCPSCRSLVPAISTKCRMCGATFDAAQEVEEKSRTHSGRVRQQTTSVAPGSEPAAEPVVEPPVAQNVEGASRSSAREEPPVQQHHAAPDIDDPLRGYVEEVEVDSDEDKSIKNGGSKNGNGQVARSAPSAPPPSSHREHAPTTNSETPQTKEGARVVVESGKGRPGGLSFNKGEARADSSSRRSESSSASPRQSERSSEQRPAQPRQQSQSPQGSAQGSTQGSSHRSPQGAPRIQGQERGSRNEPQQHQGQRQQATSTPFQGARQKTPQQQYSGSVIGWFVDLADKNGSPIELREGHFFISKSKLKENDLIVDHDSISTPHALVRVSRKVGVEMQDLMSEKGVQLKRFGGSSFSTHDERLTLGHGDVVRLGEVEYLVVIIPMPME